jgi:hypothetical protein
MTDDYESNNVLDNNNNNNNNNNICNYCQTYYTIVQGLAHIVSYVYVLSTDVRFMHIRFFDENRITQNTPHTSSR